MGLAICISQEIPIAPFSTTRNSIIHIVESTLLMRVSLGERQQSTRSLQVVAPPASQEELEKQRFPSERDAVWKVAAG